MHETLYIKPKKNKNDFDIVLGLNLKLAYIRSYYLSREETSLTETTINHLQLTMAARYIGGRGSYLSHFDKSKESNFHSALNQPRHRYYGPVLLLQVDHCL